MNQETNDFLKENLIEAHTIFNSILSEMQNENITFSYDILKEKEMASFQLVIDTINKMDYNVIEYNDLKKRNVDIFNVEYQLYLKYVALYCVSIAFIKLFYKVFDTSELNDIFKYIVGMFLGSTYIGLMSKDINDNRSGTKEKRDLINKLLSLKEEYKNNHDVAVNEINYIFALNTNLWKKVDKGKILVKN